MAKQIFSAAQGKSSNGATYPGPFTVRTSTRNSVRALVSPTLLSPGPLAKLKSVLASADVDLSGVPDQAVSIITLDQDSVVVPNNFDTLLAKFPEKIKQSYKIDHTKLQVLSPFSKTLGRPVFVSTEHMHALVYEFLYALQSFNSF